MQKFYAQLFLFLMFFLSSNGYAYNSKNSYNSVVTSCCKETITIHPSTVGHAWKEEFTDEEQARRFNSKLLYLLDHKKKTFLLRGNLPEDKNEFNYDQLVKAIKEYLNELKIPISNNFKIMDISFLNYFLEHEQIEIEKSWFEKNPDKGCFWLYPIYGALINPNELPEAVRDFCIRHEDIDGQKALVQRLKSLISTPCSLDVVYYMHCYAGKDRTGECSTNYMMANGSSYKDSIALAEKIAGRKLSFLSINAIRWYAFYLRDIEKKSWIGPIE